MSGLVADWRVHDTAASHLVPSRDEPGLVLHLRAHADAPSRPPVLFVHGATFASRLFDIPHPGASWLAATARAGFAAYALDLRGYGRSRAPSLSRASAPYARAAQVVQDIDDAARWLCARHRVDRIRLVGGSWGTITTALYAATLGAGRVSRLALFAPIYAERNQGWLDLLSDPSDPNRLDPAFGAYRLVTEAETRRRWDSEIPEGAAWRDEAVFRALLQSAFADDGAALERDPPAFRAPNGTFVDLWEAFNGRPLYDPRAIGCPVLLIRGGADPTSTRSDALALLDTLAAQDKRYVEISNGAHFVSAERRAPAVFSETNAFLAEGDAR